ncbi:nuclear transport factor 2 family protein [Pseudoxanthomonas sp.]|uniref:nuclear transport factor 2 family protein n=1 Tax=Pseudoxanthomonas sp. TaxID=1871049 RepID=UPI00260C35F2|nr:nuclear transport factor 2 family protein [Pseudoxanthomonas sp.]WDS37654.1 MAG: nuclear transport factor 2 family protein [Pseudoxanthomonas sp.]
MRLPTLLAAIPIAVLLFVSPDGHAAAIASTPQAAVQQYVQAESKFDLDALKAVLDPQFIEISPLGQVDDHAAVLSFYAPEKKMDGPSVQLAQTVVHDHGDTAVVSAQLSYAMQGHAMTLTLGAVARKTPQGWQLLSAQYTPVRENRNPAAAP